MSTPTPEPAPRGRRTFTEQFKADAVAMVVELGRPRAEVAKDLGISASSLGRWVAAATGTEGTGRGSHLRRPDPTSEDPVQLRRRVAELEQENAFLKKAAAFFAKEHR